MMPIGARLNSAFQQMIYAHGYDHNWVLNKRPGDGIGFAARAYDPHTGRVIDCFTTEPGLQVYTSNGLNGSLVGQPARRIGRPRRSRWRRSIFPTARTSRTFRRRS